MIIIIKNIMEFYYIADFEFGIEKDEYFCYLNLKKKMSKDWKNFSVFESQKCLKMSIFLEILREILNYDPILS